MGCVDLLKISSTNVNSENVVKSIDSTFETKACLGVGAHGRVMECENKQTKERVAVKRLPRSRSTAKIFDSEVKLLKLFDHRHIVQLVDCYMDSGHFYIATSLCKGGDLHGRVAKHHRFEEKEAVRFVSQMLEAVEYCHSKSIAHRDLKLENFAFDTPDPDSPLRLIDFGCAKVVSSDAWYRDIVGTPYYLAPEYLGLRRKKWNGDMLLAADVWAIGVLTFMLVTGEPPFNGANREVIFQNIKKQKIQFPTYRHLQLSESVQDFIGTLLRKDPFKRPSALKALQHPWIAPEGKPTSSSKGKGLIHSISLHSVDENDIRKASYTVVKVASSATD